MRRRFVDGEIQPCSPLPALRTRMSMRISFENNIDNFFAAGNTSADSRTPRGFAAGKRMLSLHVVSVVSNRT